MIVFIVNLAGAVALLLWAVRLVRTGVERAFMAQLRAALRRTAGAPVNAAFGGAVAALLMQSSTAVAMLAAAFAAAGTLGAPTGLALLLGADVGSAVVAQILLSPVQALVPLLLIAGVALFLRATSRAYKQTGRILIGIALVLISLAMMHTATDPLRDSVAVGAALQYLQNDLISAFVLGALLAWAMHSSVAAVLMFVTLTAAALLTVPVAAALVLGANLGGAMIPVLLTLSAAPVARRIVIGNLVLRGGAAVLVLATLPYWIDLLPALGAAPPRQVINLHLLFNIAVAAAGLPLVRPVLGAASVFLPDSAARAPGDRLTALDPTALENADRALACAAREVLRMGEAVHAMLVPALGLFREWDENVVAAIIAGENEVDRMHFDIKLYIARLQESRLSPAQSRRAMDLAGISNNFEDAGDQISSNLVDMARRMHTTGKTFSEEGWRDLADFHDRVLSNTQTALNVLMTGDPEAARQLVEEKDHTRIAEQELQARHLDRLRGGNAESIETSNLHQETVRALKQINTDFSYVAYPIAEEAGELLSSRLASTAGGNDTGAGTGRLDTGQPKTPIP